MTPPVRPPRSSAAARALGAAVLAWAGLACSLVSGWNDLRSGEPSAPADAGGVDAMRDDGATPDGALASDAGPDAPLSCLWNAPFTSVQPLPPSVNETGARANYPTLSEDERTLYFQKVVDAELQIFRSTRASKNDPFGTAEQVGRSGVIQANPSLSVDGRRLAFSADPSKSGSYEIRIAEVSEAGVVDFDGARLVPTLLPPGSIALMPYFASDDSLWYVRREPNTSGVYRTPLLADGGTNGVLFEPNAENPMVTRDLKTLYVVRAGVLLRGHRENTAAAFSGFTTVPDLKVANHGASYVSWVSADECTVYFGAVDANAAGGPSELYVARRAPP